MRITFITGNAGKFAEAKAILADHELAQATLELPELQELDDEAVIRAKLEAARGNIDGAYLVEDTSLTFDCLGGKLPGPFIKWFRATLGVEGLVELTERYENPHATASVMVGYCDEAGAMHFFKGEQRGVLVRPRGDQDFDWGPAFVPEGQPKTFGEMSREEKHAFSMRGIAFAKLRDFLANHG